MLEQGRGERHWRHAQLETADVDAPRRGEAIRIEHLLGVDAVRRLDAAVALHVPEADIHLRNADVGPVKAGVVVEAPGGPHPPELPPVADAPGVVALAEPVELDALLPDVDRAVHRARDLVSSRGDVVVRRANGLPLEVEGDRHLIAARNRVVQRRGIVDAQTVGLVADGEVLERRLDDVVGPQPVRAQLETGRLRQRRLVVHHRDRLSTRTDEIRVIPRDAEVGVQPDANPTSDGSVR